MHGLLNHSPISSHVFNDRPFYLKRDDLLHPQFSGNKARKLMAFLDGDFPQITTLISYGSVQSNTLYSLAALAKLKSWQLNFYVDHIPQWLSQNPIGNYQAALALGANIIPTDDHHLSLSDHVKNVCQPNQENIVIPEGAHMPEAELGIRQLAAEILDWKTSQSLDQLTVALPSGTGTTALYLHKHLKDHQIQVLTCACVGGHDYLIEQFSALHQDDHPMILNTPKRLKHQFGKLYKEDHQIWQALKKQTDIEFDLLYDPYMWLCLNDWFESNPDKPLLYIHQGGILGNQSMLKRYQYKFFVKPFA